jgi:site-specific recombinase XerD
MTVGSVPPAVPGSKPKKLLDRTRDVLRLKHYSLRTEQSYCDWIERFIRFHQLRHPKEMGVAEITQFLTYLARIGNVSAATQNQALSGLLFLYQQVLKQELGWIDEAERAKRRKRIPVVLIRDEIRKIFAHMHGMPRLMRDCFMAVGFV